MGPTDALPGLSYSVFLTWKLTYRAACSDNLLELPLLIVYFGRYEHGRVATVREVSISSTFATTPWSGKSPLCTLVSARHFNQRPLRD